MRDFYALSKSAAPSSSKSSNSARAQKSQIMRRLLKRSHPLRNLLMLALALTLCFKTASAEELEIPFAELAQTADLIFVGTVAQQSTRLNDKRTMIFTDVVFKDIQVVSATPKSAQRETATVRLTYAGGSFGGRTVEVGDAPRFTDGSRYLIFMLDDGQTYFTPIIGGGQGLFEVVRDAASGQDYVLTAGRKAIIGIGEEGFVTSEHRVASIKDGALVAERDANDPAARTAGPATPADGNSSFSPRVVPDEKQAHPLTLNSFIDYIRNVALKQELKEREINRGGGGNFYRRDSSGKVQAERIQTSAPPVRVLALGPDDNEQTKFSTEVPRASAEENSLWRRPSGPSAVEGGAVGACGYHTLDLVMEQVPSSWWEWQVANDNMYVWNQAMDIFSYSDDDGSWGDNSQNEFGGYPSSADLTDVYGASWGATTLAMHIGSYTGDVCGVIDQSDIFWNPAFSWTDDFSLALDGTAKLLRSVNQHETGHAWGAQRGSYAETYDYDIPTVMHSYSRQRVEDGWGIHYVDAYLIRRQYDEDRPINTTTRDVGVESYYASNGLKNSTTDATSYKPGDSITLSNITVENMSYNAVSDMRIRFFLSTNNIISTGDYQLGSYWFWNSFCGECYNTGNYATTIPSNIPPGTYYVGAIVSINGFGSDDLTWNNATYFYKKITVTCDGSFVFNDHSSDSFGPGGGTGTLFLTSSGSSCPWSAYSDASWLTITSATSGTGSATITYSASANTGSGSRFTLIHVGGLNYGVFQSPGCLATTASSVQIGQTINGSLASTDCLSPARTRPGGYRPYADRYSFYAVSGQTLAIALGSSAFDTYLYLIGPNGAVITSDDDGGAGTNSRIPAESGNYTIPMNGTYTIEVTSYAENKVGSYTLRLIGTVLKFTISGRVTVGTTSLAGVTMTLSGDRRFTPVTTTTLSNGTFSFANVPAGGTYTVTPTKTNYSFTPGSRTYTTLNGDRTATNFSAALKTYSITGKIFRGTSTVGLDGVLVRITAAGFTTKTLTTTTSGVYTFTALPAGKSYTVTPTRTGYTFSPTTRTFPNLSANQPNGAGTKFSGTPN